MNIRGWLTLGAVLAATATAALAGSAAAGAAPSAPARSTASGAGLATPGTVLGVVRARGARLAAAAPRVNAACATEPNCNMQYWGGPVQLKPRVYVVFWGPKWKTSKEQGALRLLTAMYKGLGQAKDTWSLAAAQYPNRSGNHATFGSSVFGGAVIDANNPQKSVSFANLEGEAKKIATHFNIKNTANAQIVIAAQSGTCFAQVQGLVFVGSCGVTPTSPPPNGYCGYHTAVADGSSYLTFTNLPYEVDAGQWCGEGFQGGTLDGFTMVGGHEFAETVSDPIGNGWIDINDPSGGEIADKCAWGGPGGNTDPFGNIALSTGNFPMQSLWSNVKRACVMTGKLPFAVTKLGNQVSTIGKAVHVQVSAHTTPKVGLKYHVTGLPRGLSITNAGLIHGTPAGPAGTSHVKVTVSYYAGSATFSFTWLIKK